MTHSSWVQFVPYKCQSDRRLLQCWNAHIYIHCLMQEEEHKILQRSRTALHVVS